MLDCILNLLVKVKNEKFFFLRKRNAKKMATERKKNNYNTLMDYSNIPMHEGNKYYLISKVWFDNCLNIYVTVNLGIINNSRLIDSNGKLKIGLLRDYDYITVNEKSWNYLKKVFGYDFEICRKVIKNRFTNHLWIETYPLTINVYTKREYDRIPNQNEAPTIKIYTWRKTKFKDFKQSICQQLFVNPVYTRVYFFNFFIKGNEIVSCNLTLTELLITDNSRFLFEVHSGGKMIKPCKRK